MSAVRLTKDGQITDADHLITFLPHNFPLHYLGYQVNLEPGFSLRAFFRFLAHYPHINQINLYFSSLNEQVMRAPESDCQVPGIGYLFFHKTIEMIGFPGEPRMEIYTALKGIFKEREVDVRMYQLDKLLDMELRLGKLKHVVFGDQMDTFYFDTVFTLFEFIDGILWALSFHNTPQECKITMASQ